MSETLETAAAPEQDDLSADLNDAFSDIEAVDASAADPTTAPDTDDDFAPEPEPATTEQPRGPDGKFAPKAETPSVAAEAPVAAEPPSAEAAPEPFQYRATGKTHAWEGVTFDAKGQVIVAPEQVPVLRQKLAAAAQFEAETYPRVQRLEQENQQLKAQQSQKEAVADAVTKKFSEMATLYTQDPQRALEGVIALFEQLPQQMQQAEIEYWKSQAEAVKLSGKPQAVSPYADSPTGYPAREIAQAAVTDEFEALKLALGSSPKYRGAITEADWQQIGAHVAQMAPAFLRQATAEEASQYGLQPGEYALDIPMLTADIEARLAPVLAERAKVKAATEAAKFNKGAIPQGKAPQRTPAKAPAMAAAPVKKDAREEARAREQFKRDFKKKLMSSPVFPDDDDE